MELTPNLQPTFIFGFSSGVKGGAHFIDHNRVVFPVGNVLAFHCINENKQKYIRVKGSFKINSIAISPNRKVIAVAMTGPKPVISFYDTKTLSRLMTVGNPAEGFKARVFKYLAFSQDSVYLIAVTSEPEGLLILYKWETGGIVAYAKADGKPTSVNTPITIIAPHPQDTTIIALGGPGVFRLVALYYNEWRQFGFKRAEYWPISGICWITSELVLVSTKDGRLMVIEESLVKGEYKVDDLVELRVSAKDDFKKVEVEKSRTKQSETEFNVQGLTAFPLGFAFAYIAGEVCVFQKVGKRRWLKKNVILSGAPSLWENHLASVNLIKFINFSPSGESILATSSSNEIYYSPTFREQDQKFERPLYFEKIHDGYHFGPVATISACLYKPLFLTAGSVDRSCLVWNFESLRLVNSKTFSEDIITAAFHPSGWYCAVAFDKNVQMLMLLMDGIKIIATLTVKNSNLLSYSKLGHNLACVNGINIDIYSTTTFEKMWELPTTGTISTLLFSENDFVLFLGSLDGVVDKYCMKTGGQLLHLEMENNVIHGMAATNDGGILYIVGADGCLKVYQTDQKVEISPNKASSIHPLNNSVLTSVALGCEDTVLLIGAQTNSILALQAPIVPNCAQMSTFTLHSNSVVKIEITHVNPTVLSLGHDGVVTVWKLINLSRKQFFLKYYREVDETIVNASNWSNKRAIIKEQQEIMSKMDRKYDEQVRQIEVEKRSSEAKVSERYQGVLDIINLNNKITKEKNSAEVGQMRCQNRELISNFEKELSDHRTSFEGRLRKEQEQFDKLKIGWNNLKNGFDQLIKSVKLVGQCISKRLEYFTSVELIRRANKAFLTRDEVIHIIEEQKNRELNLLKNSQFEIDEIEDASERHEQLVVEIIDLRGQKQKLSEQVEALESIYFNVQEFLKEAHVTVGTFDKRKALRYCVEIQQKKIEEKLKRIKESGEDIVGDLEISKMFKMQHMVSEESIETLCELNDLMEEHKKYKRKERKMKSELTNLTRCLTKMKYSLSFLSLQNYLHNNAVRKSVLREKFFKRKIRYLRTNLSREIHSMLCSAESGNLKGRLINLLSTYADANLDTMLLGSEKSGEKDFWKALTHLEATKLHFDRCFERAKTAKTPRSYSSKRKSYLEKYDNHADRNKPEPSEETLRWGEDSKSEVTRFTPAGKGDEMSFGTLPTKESQESSEFGYFYRSTSSDSSSSCTCISPDIVDDRMELKKTQNQTASVPNLKKKPVSVLMKKRNTENEREGYFGELLNEKKLMFRRLVDLKKRLGRRLKSDKELLTSQRASYFGCYYKIPMNAIIESLDKEVAYLSKTSEMRDIATDLIARKMTEDSSEMSVPNTIHLCSLCKNYEMFSKYFEKPPNKLAVCGLNLYNKKSETGFSRKFHV